MREANASIQSYVRNYLGIDIFAEFNQEKRVARCKDVFGFCLDGSEDVEILASLHRFADDAPWTYWNPDKINCFIDLIYKNSGRITLGIAREARALDVAFNNMLSDQWRAEERRHSLDKADDLMEVGRIFLPSYLRVAEHIFVNFLRFVANVSGRQNFQGARNELARLRQLTSLPLDGGYDERIRNSIAHGEVSFRADKVVMGRVPHVFEISIGEIEDKFDDLWGTVCSIAIAIIISISRCRHSKDDILREAPPSIVAFLLDGLRGHQGFQYVGGAERVGGRGSEINIYCKSTRMAHRELVFEYLKVALSVSELSGRRFDWLQLAIDTGIGSNSLFVMNTKQIAAAADDAAPFERLEGAMPVSLFWQPRSAFVGRLLLLKKIASMEIEKRRSDSDLKINVRSVENMSIGNRVRIRILATVAHGQNEYSKEDIRRALKKILVKYERKFFWTLRRGLQRGFSIYRRPSYVWVDLYKVDASLRRIGQGGWTGGNLIASSEFKRWPWLKTILPHKKDYREGPFSMILDKPEMFR